MKSTTGRKDVIMAKPALIVSLGREAEIASTPETGFLATTWTDSGVDTDTCITDLGDQQMSCP